MVLDLFNNNLNVSFRNNLWYLNDIYTASTYYSSDQQLSFPFFHLHPMIDCISYNEHLISKGIQSVHPVWWSVCHVLVSEPTPQEVHTATQKKLHSPTSQFFLIILFIACLFFLDNSFHMHQSLCMCSVLLLWCVNCCVFASCASLNRTRHLFLMTQKTKLVVFQTMRPDSLLMHDLSTHCSCWGMCPSALFVLSGVH